MIKINFVFYKNNKELINYLMFGFLTTLVNIIIYYICSRILRIGNLMLCSCLSWIFAVIFAYITNRIYVFKSCKRNIVNEFFKFICSRIFTGIIFEVIIFGIISLYMNDLISKIIIQIIIVILNFLYSKLIIFNGGN